MASRGAKVNLGAVKIAYYSGGACTCQRRNASSICAHAAAVLRSEARRALAARCVTAGASRERVVTPRGTSSRRGRVFARCFGAGSLSCSSSDDVEAR